MSTDVSTNHLPPKIRELLNKRGWTWPPTPEQRRQTHEAWENLTARTYKTSPEVLAEVRREMPGRLPDLTDEE